MRMMSAADCHWLNASFCDFRVNTTSLHYTGAKHTLQLQEEAFNQQHSNAANNVIPIAQAELHNSILNSVLVFCMNPSLANLVVKWILWKKCDSKHSKSMDFFPHTFVCENTEHRPQNIDVTENSRAEIVFWDACIAQLWPFQPHCCSLWTTDCTSLCIPNDVYFKWILTGVNRLYFREGFFYYWSSC